MQLKPNFTSTSITPQCVYTLLGATMINFRTFIVFFHYSRRESCSLYRTIRHKFDQHLIRTGNHIWRHFVTTVDFQDRTVFFETVPDFDVVVDTAVVVLYVERVEPQSNLMVLWYCYSPYAFFARVVFFWIVGGFQSTFEIDK